MRHSQRICLFCIRANRHLCLVNLVLCRSVPCIDQDFVLVRAVYEQAPKILGIHLAAAQGIEDKVIHNLLGIHPISFILCIDIIVLPGQAGCNDLSFPPWIFH